jgi:hypothetical protein
MDDGSKEMRGNEATRQREGTGRGDERGRMDEAKRGVEGSMDGRGDAVVGRRWSEHILCVSRFQIPPELSRSVACCNTIGPIEFCVRLVMGYSMLCSVVGRRWYVKIFFHFFAFRVLFVSRFPPSCTMLTNDVVP